MSVKLIPYVNMPGNANEAIDFYQKALGAQLLFKQTFGEMPANPEFPLPEEARSLVGHASLQVGESVLMMSDTFPGMPLQTGDQVTICISLSDAEQARQVFDALSQGGNVRMELQETHFSPAYGNVTDKFGITFQIFTEMGQ